MEKEQQMLKEMSCAELRAYLEQNWEEIIEGRRVFVASLMTKKRCLEVVPYLIRQLDSLEATSRERALFDLATLGCRQQRERFIKLHLNDADPDVRRNALSNLGEMFRGESDPEILRLALTAYEAPNSDIAMQLTAAATMMYQLGIPHDEKGQPAWWDEENVEALQHPAIRQAIAETRKLLMA